MRHKWRTTETAVPVAGRVGWYLGLRRYARIYGWQLGAEINRPYYAARASEFADWGRAKHVVLFPSPFDGRSKKVPAGNSTTLRSTAMLEHFLAYVHGAAMNMSLPL